jgi:hypothetical protein
MNKKIVGISLLCGLVVAQHGIGMNNESRILTKSWRPPSSPILTVLPQVTITDHFPISMEILKREIREATIPVILQRVQAAKDDFYAQVGEQHEGHAYMVPTLLEVTKTFNGRMTDPLAHTICSLVAQKEAQPGFRAEQSTERTDFGMVIHCSQRSLDMYTRYTSMAVNGVPSITCKLTVSDANGDLLDAAIAAVEREQQ